MNVCSLGTNLLNVSEVFQLSLAVSYERKGYWVTSNPVYFVCAEESGMTPNPTQWMLFPTKTQNGRLFLLLTSHSTSISSFIYLQRAEFLSDLVAMVSVPVWDRTCVWFIYYGMLRIERADQCAGSL